MLKPRDTGSRVSCSWWKMPILLVEIEKPCIIHSCKQIVLCLILKLILLYTNRPFYQQPTARPSGNDYSYRRMDGGLHINGGLPQGDSIPMHLTNGYGDNMTNVCPVIDTVMHVRVSSYWYYNACAWHPLSHPLPWKQKGCAMRESCVLRLSVWNPKKGAQVNFMQWKLGIMSQWAWFDLNICLVKTLLYNFASGSPNKSNRTVRRINSLVSMFGDKFS